MRRTVELVADEIQPIDAGWAIRTPSLPDVWSLNHIRVAAPIEFADAVEVADQQFDALPYRHIVVDHDAGAHLDRRFAAAGWKVEREVVMALTRAPEQPPTATTVIQPSEDEMLELMERWGAEELRSSIDQLRELAAARVAHGTSAGSPSQARTAVRPRSRSYGQMEEPRR